ncbi:MAG TPA: Xaa-Pro peptidase family protein [Bacteroidales bacterium]|nr:Xaa-Pro peptidase family protein [Bacteroidales bacterium]
MKKKFITQASLAVVLSFICINLAGQGLTFGKEEYAARRAKLMEKTSDGIAIIFGATHTTGYDLYAQSNDFIYFTGVEIPNSILIVDGIRKQSTIFFTSTEREAEGEGISPELVRDPVGITGIERHMQYEQFTSALDRLSFSEIIFYTPFLPQEIGREAATEKLNVLRSDMVMNEWDGRPTREQQFVKMLNDRYPQVTVRNCSKAIEELRIIKSPAEIDIIRKAGQIGVKAMIETMRSTRAGMYEYEVAALYEYMCQKEGVRDIAYNTIISSDKNHPYLHYYKHDRLLKDGDFLVMDVGPDVEYYDIDITISYPANGKFTPNQAEFYNACNEIEKACLRFMKAGRTPEQVGEMARDYLEKEKGFDLSKKYWDTLSRYLRRGAVSHYVGLAIHDIGGSAREELKAGMVLAIDVLGVFADENMGVRVEDTVVITEEGYENLSAGLPREIKEIETLMKQDGAVQLMKEKKLY